MSIGICASDSFSTLPTILIVNSRTLYIFHLNFDILKICLNSTRFFLDVFYKPQSNCTLNMKSNASILSRSKNSKLWIKTNIVWSLMMSSLWKLETRKEMKKKNSDACIVWCMKLSRAHFLKQFSRFICFCSCCFFVHIAQNCMFLTKIDVYFAFELETRKW